MERIDPTRIRERLPHPHGWLPRAGRAHVAGPEKNPGMRDARTLAWTEAGAVSRVGGPTSSTTPQRPHRRRGVLALLVMVVVLVLTGVAVVVRGVGDDDDDSGATAATTPVVLSNQPTDLDQTLEATVGSLREFWAAEFPRIYDERFEDLAGGIQPKTEDSPPWTCNRERLTYDDIRGNAFYCGGGGDDYIAYDAASL